MNAKTLYKCPTCTNEFYKWASQTGNKAYCSKKCYSTSLEGNIPYNKGKKTIVEKKCANCSNIISGMKSFVSKRKYCSKECSAQSLVIPIETILKNYTIDSDTGCWSWNGSKRGGYGRVRHNGILTGVHRVSYEFAKGSIPNGLVIDHLCRNRACLNPDHLEAVTTHENIKRGNAGKGTRSEAHKKAISEGGKRRFQNPEALEKQRAILDNARASNKRLDSVRIALKSDEYRAKQSIAIKKSWEKRKNDGSMNHVDN